MSLGPDARSLIESVRGEGSPADGPSVEDKLRVKKQLALQLTVAGAGAGVALGSSKTAAAAATGGGSLSLGKLLGYVAIGAAVGGGGSLGVVAVTQGRGPEQAAVQQAEAAGATADLRRRSVEPGEALLPHDGAAAPAVEDEEREVAVKAPASPEESRASAHGARSLVVPRADFRRRQSHGLSRNDRAATEPEVGSNSENLAQGVAALPELKRAPPEQARPAPSALTRELQELSRVEKEIARGRGDRALRLLNEKPAGSALASERLAARAIALCQAGRVQEARAAAAEFLRRYPSSPLAPRVRGSCQEKK